MLACTRLRRPPLRLTALVAGLAAAAFSAQPAAAAPQDWPTYHRDLSRSGMDPNLAPFAGVGLQWTSPTLDGLVYAEPLLVGSRIIVATEGDSVYALDAATGAVAWKTTVGTSVLLTIPPFQCGNINPIGITSTPAVDLVGGVIYVAGMTQPHDYQLSALDLGTGALKFQVPIALPGFEPTVQQQRGALAFANGMVYVPFGGFAGDCGAYHGWVVAVRGDGTGGVLSFQVPTGRGGGVWAPSGPSVDAAGSVYVATGNSFTTAPPFDFGESVIRLSPMLVRQDFFAPSDWASLNATDTDLGSVGPALLANGLVFQVGKAGVGYLLNAARLSASADGIGGEAFSAQVCNAESFGGTAYNDPFIYVPCTDGLRILRLGAGPSFAVLASGPVFQAGPPIVAGGAVWTLDVVAGTLYALDPMTAQPTFSTPVGPMTRFATPASGLGRIYVATGSQVKAYASGLGSFHPLSPARILDTRSTGGALGPGAPRDIPVTGQGGVPAGGVAAVVLNVTVTNTTARSYLTVYPTGSAQPLTSNLNWVPGQKVPNLVEVGVGAGGQITAVNAFGSTDLVVDVAGWVSVQSATPAPDGLYNPLVPARILDTRNGTGGFSQPVGPGQTISIQVAGRGGVPASGVVAVIMNVTATQPTAASFLTMYPAGDLRPLASNLNFVPGQTVPNRVVVKLGTAGQVTVFNPFGSVHVVGDVSGWFTDASNPAATGSLFAAVAPTRILDTRSGLGAPAAPIAPGGVLPLAVAGQAGLPGLTSATPPKAVVLNVTVTQPSAPGYLTLWPDGVGQPLASDVNFAAGQTVPNLVVVQLGGGKIDIFNSAGSTHVVVDVMGWYG